MQNFEELRINLRDPDPGLIMAVLFAVFSDLFFLLFPPLGFLCHYLGAAIIGSAIWPRLKAPDLKGEATDAAKAAAKDPGLDELINKAIGLVVNSKIILGIAMALPLPLLSIGLGIAILLQNAMIDLLVKIAIKLVVVGAVTGGVGDIAEGAAAVGELGEAAAAAAEAGEAAATAAEATEAAAAGAEAAEAASAAGEAAEAGEAAGEAAEEAAEEGGKEGFKDQFKKEAKKRLKERGEGGEEDEEEGEGEEGGEEDGDESPEEQQLQDILSGNYIGRVLRESLDPSELLSRVGDEEPSDDQEFQPEATPRPKPPRRVQVRQPKDNMYNNEVVDLRDQSQGPAAEQ